MIKRLAHEEEHPSPSPTKEDSISESIEDLDLTPQSPAMSAVFGTGPLGGDLGNGRRSSSQSPSRARRASGTGASQIESTGKFRLPSFGHHKRTASQQSSLDDKGSQKRGDHLTRWFTSGNVIYKNVGLGLMDLVVGLEIVKLANAKGVGSRVESFSP